MNIEPIKLSVSPEIKAYCVADQLMTLFIQMCSRNVYHTVFAEVKNMFHLDDEPDLAYILEDMEHFVKKTMKPDGVDKYLPNTTSHLVTSLEETLVSVKGMRNHKLVASIFLGFFIGEEEYEDAEKLAQTIHDFIKLYWELD